MINKITQIVRRQEFYPSLLGVFIHPYYFARKGLLDNLKKYSSALGGRILDIGCGHKPYRGLFSCDEYLGLEIDSPKSRANPAVDKLYDGKTIPFADAYFDSVIATQVLEHVFEPAAWLREIHRVLKPGGRLLLTVPFVWDEHEPPYDYARYTSFGLAHLVKSAGFEIIEQNKIMTGTKAVTQLVNAYHYKYLVPKKRFIRLIGCLIFIAPFNLLGLLFAAILPENKDLYLDNIVLAKKHA